MNGKHGDGRVLIGSAVEEPDGQGLYGQEGADV